MRAGDQHCLGRSDEVGIDVALAERHVGAVLAIEEEWESVIALDRQDRQRRQPFLVDADARCHHALAAELLEDEATHLLIADPGDQRGAEAETCRPDGNVGGRAAHRLGEGGDILQARADLLSVKVDRGAADGDDVEHVQGPGVDYRKSLIRDRAAQVG
jgi:hypothetical protein